MLRSRVDPIEADRCAPASLLGRKTLPRWCANGPLWPVRGSCLARRRVPTEPRCVAARDVTHHHGELHERPRGRGSARPRHATSTELATSGRCGRGRLPPCSLLRQADVLWPRATAHLPVSRGQSEVDVNGRRVERRCCGITLDLASGPPSPCERPMHSGHESENLQLGRRSKQADASNRGSTSVTGARQETRHPELGQHRGGVVPGGCLVSPRVRRGRPVR